MKKFPGPRSLRNHPVDNLEAALMADGVAKDKLYPIDVDRAFKKLDQIQPHINVWWTTGQQPAQLLVDKEVVLATGWNGRFYDLIRKEAPLAIEWNGGILKQGSWVVPKGAKDQYWAMKMLAADVRSQAAGRQRRGARLFRHASRLQSVRRRRRFARCCRCIPTISRSRSGSTRNGGPRTARKWASAGTSGCCPRRDAAGSARGTP